MHTCVYTTVPSNVTEIHDMYTITKKIKNYNYYSFTDWYYIYIVSYMPKIPLLKPPLTSNVTQFYPALAHACATFYLHVPVF